VSKLEDVLANTSIEPSVGKGTHLKIWWHAHILILFVFLCEDQGPFVTSQAAAVWVAISSCWSAEVYIPELNHRFWKFTLQVGFRRFLLYAGGSQN
jgi:hypothetical protein